MDNEYYVGYGTCLTDFALKLRKNIVAEMCGDAYIKAQAIVDKCLTELDTELNAKRLRYKEETK